MEKENNRSAVLEDERTRSVSERYFAHAFCLLAAYIVLGVAVKPFLFDIPVVHYWDAAAVMILAYLYVLVQTARHGVVVGPEITWRSLGMKNYLKSFGTASLLFGFLCSFVLLPLSEETAAWFEGTVEKIAGGLVTAFLFFLLISGVLFLIDYLPAKAARKKADEMMGDGQA